MKRTVLAGAAVLLAACGGNNPNIGSGQFLAPTALATVSVADRDLLFVAGTGRDGLRALQICEGLDSNLNTVPTCGSDLQFVPGPIRVFPANVETGNRPIRLAGVRLIADGGTPADAGTADAGAADAGTTDAGAAAAPIVPGGAILAAGADNNIHVVDAQNILDASDGGTASPATVVSLTSPGGPPAGVVADVVADPAFDQDFGLPLNESSATAFAVTSPSGAAPAQLFQLTITLQNGAPLTQIAGSCSMPGVAPSRLAVAQRSVPPEAPTLPVLTDIFVADGAGDGVVRVTRGSLVPGGGPCEMTRISAGGRSVRSIALSPKWFEGFLGAITHPAGEFLMMVLEPSATTPTGTDFNSGGVLFADLCSFNNAGQCASFDRGAILPIPPTRFDRVLTVPVDGGTITFPLQAQAMEPISPQASIPQDAVFLQPSKQENVVCPGLLACTPIFVGQPSNNPLQAFPLLAAVTSSDGATYFIDVPNRRFVNSNFFGLTDNLIALTPTFLVFPVLTPPSSDPNGPALVGTPSDPAHPGPSWVQAGVTHSGTWRVVWHGAIPNLDRGGTLTSSGRGTFFLDSNNGQDFALAQADPVLHFGVGDTVTFLNYSLTPAASSGACANVLNVSSEVPFFEATVVAFDPTVKGRLEVAIPSSVPFALGDCPAIGVVAEFHAAGAKPWMVFDNTTVVQRIASNEKFDGHQRRFDYPYDYLPDPNNPFVYTQPPTVDTDIAVSFQIVGHEPTIPGSEFTFIVQSQDAPVVYSDAVLPEGMATGILDYVSPAHPNLVFTAVTGTNSLILAEPEILGTQELGLVVFR